jgi:exonuclease VII large subunit
LRRSFQSSPSTALVRRLASWRSDGVDASGQDVAERLGQWLHVAEAIRLHATQGQLAAAASLGVRRQPAGLQQQLQQELDRLRAAMTRSIRTVDPAHRPDLNDLDTEFALYHQRLNDLQRRMEMGVDALRQHVRQQVALVNPELAALDAVMDPLFAGREQRLLTSLPSFLRARFVALQQQAAETASAEPLDWLQTFSAEFEQLLLAELDLRLLPVVGLIESLDP